MIFETRFCAKFWIKVLDTVVLFGSSVTTSAGYFSTFAYGNFLEMRESLLKYPRPLIWERETEERS